MKNNKALVAVVLIYAIISTLITPSFASRINPKTIYISNIKDLHQLSKNCTFDRWSQGVTVVLENDIDLTGEDFTPIPIFSGTFEGQGHSIRGLSIVVEGSNQGLFRYLQEDGIIRDIIVEGVVTPTGEKSNIGGIVGNNMGTIENCSFSGYVKGDDVIGGLVGWNGTSGMVINSSANGIIYGNSKVGGIVGYNAGVVLRCSNDSYVNTTVEEHKLDLQTLTIDDINISKLSQDVMDIGGVAGVSTGIVKSSENRGIIGYPHIGYNIGGIVGRQVGYIASCLNYGNIYGRKEVGGIVGQMEPYISLVIPPSTLKKLQDELNTLQLSITKMINNTRYASNEMTQKLSSIQEEIDNSKDNAKTLINLTELLINKDMEEINRISVTIVEVMDQMIPIMDSLSKSVDIMEEASIPIKKSMRYMSRAMDDMSQLSDEFNELSLNLEQAIVEIKDTEEYIRKCYQYLTKAMELLQSGTLDGVLDLFKSAGDSLKIAMEKLSHAFNRLEKVGNNISEMIASAGDMSGNMSKALNYMIDAMDIMDDLTDELDIIIDGINEMLNYLVNEPPLEFATTDDIYQRVKEDLYSDMDRMSSSLSEFINTMNIQGNTMMDDMQSINDQLLIVMSLMFNLFDEITNVDDHLENIVRDVSQEDTDQKTEGKVSDSKNFGTIEGDINVGGIAGAMSVEVKMDPEEDLKVMNKANINTVYETSAVIRRCENVGGITAKKNHIGGIVGNMDLGYVKDCIASGTVISTDGNYVGGIAGKSYGTIVSSYAKCALDGGNYVGGIAGFGKKIISSYTLIKINRYKACFGAIAGNIDKDSEVRNNYFVSDSLAGIDGISYADKAEPIEFEKLIEVENLPIIFKKFQLTFWADEKLVSSFDFNYGDSIPVASIPEVPIKEGYYGKWDEFNTANITFDNKILANYIPYLTVIESKEKRNGTLSILLIEGSFIDEDSLVLVQENIDCQYISKNITILEQWSVTIPNDGNPSHTIRYLPKEEKKNLDIYILTNEKWIRVDSTWDGKYLVFNCDGNNITFSIVDNGVSYVNRLILTFFILFTILFVVFCVIKRKKATTLG